MYREWRVDGVQSDGQVSPLAIVQQSAPADAGTKVGIFSEMFTWLRPVLWTEAAQQAV